jgi:putative transport protein
LNWLVATLPVSRAARFCARDGFWIAGKQPASLGSVTATPLVAIASASLGISISGPIKSTFFLLFLFAVGYVDRVPSFQGWSAPDRAR